MLDSDTPGVWGQKEPKKEEKDGVGVAQCQQKLHPVCIGVVTEYVSGEMTFCLWMSAANGATFTGILILTHSLQLTDTDTHSFLRHQVAALYPQG